MHTRSRAHTHTHQHTHTHLPSLSRVDDHQAHTAGKRAHARARTRSHARARTHTHNLCLSFSSWGRGPADAPPPPQRTKQGKDCAGVTLTHRGWPTAGEAWGWRRQPGEAGPCAPRGAAQRSTRLAGRRPSRVTRDPRLLVTREAGRKGGREGRRAEPRLKGAREGAACSPLEPKGGFAFEGPEKAGRYRGRGGEGERAGERRGEWAQKGRRAGHLGLIYLSIYIG